MSRVRNEALVEQARQLELSGLSREEVAKRMGVKPRTVSRWLGPLRAGRPRIPDGAVVSERTRFRRQAEAREMPGGTA